MWSRNNNETDNASDHLAQSMWLGELSRQWDSVTAQAILQDFVSSQAACETLIQVAIVFFCDESHLLYIFYQSK